MKNYLKNSLWFLAVMILSIPFVLANNGLPGGNSGLPTNDYIYASDDETVKIIDPFALALEKTNLTDVSDKVYSSGGVVYYSGSVVLISGGNLTGAVVTTDLLNTTGLVFSIGTGGTLTVTNSNFTTGSGTTLNVNTSNATNTNIGNSTGKTINATNSITLNGNDVTDADYNSINKTGSTTWDTVQEGFQVFGSVGVIDGGQVTDSGSQIYNIAPLQGSIRTTNSESGAILTFNVGRGGEAVANNTTVFVGVEYNSGNPQLVEKATDTWNFKNEFPLACIVNEEGTLHITDSPQKSVDAATWIYERFIEVNGIERANQVGGLILGETGTRNITLSAGELYDGFNEFDITAINTTTGGDIFNTYTGALVSTGNFQWDNDNYDNSGVVTTLTNNRYANLWVYVETDGDLTVRYGTDEYVSSAGAEAEAAPSILPDRISEHGILVGRIVFQKGASTAEEVQSAFDTTFTASLAADHGNLTGLLDDDHTQYVLADGSRNMATLTIEGSGSVGTDLSIGNNIELTIPTVDNTGKCNNVLTVTVGQNTVGTGALLGISSTGATTEFVDANASSGAFVQWTQAIALEAETGTKKVCLNGLVRSSNFPFTTTGARVYTSTGSGLLMEDPNLITSSGAVIQPIGWVWSVTPPILNFSPSPATAEN